MRTVNHTGESEWGSNEHSFPGRKRSCLSRPYWLFGVILLLAAIACRQSPPEGTATAPAAGIAVPQPGVTPTIPPTTTPAYTPAFETAECQFSHPATVEITCGYLIVPENRADPQRMIRLHVAVISSYSAAPAPDPLVFLDGGPGDYTLDKAGG